MFSVSLKNLPHPASDSCTRSILYPKDAHSPLQPGSHEEALLFGFSQHLANPVRKQIPRFLPTGCKTWEKEATHLRKQLPGHLTTAWAEGWVLMKRPVYVFSAHGPNYWCLCTNPCSVGKPGGEAGHTCPSAWDPAQSTWQGLTG